MELYVTNDRDGSVIIHRPLGDDETLNPDDYIAEVENIYCGEATVSRSPGLVPLGCGDFTIEIAEYPGTAVCWASQSYYWKSPE
jgi:hypothetical protein